MLKQLFRCLRQKFRERRYQIIQKQMQVDQTSGFVLDLGGGAASFFAERYLKPEDIILVEIKPEVAYRAKSKIPAINVIIADAEQLPFAKDALVFTVCNSVIEHVANPNKLAVEIQRVSRNYFLQTPNGRFPLETHSFIAIPFYSWLPGIRTKQIVCKLFGANFDYVKSVGYLSEVKLRRLFPQAHISYERFLLLKKSFYVYQRNGSGE